MANAKEIWMSICCVVADADKDVLRDCPRLDRMIVGGDAVMLLMVGTLATIVWYLFFASFLPVTQAAFAGGLVGTMILLLDRRIGSSDWTLAGVLSGGGWPKPQWWVRLLVRVAVAFMFASVTATGLTLALYKDTLSEQLRLEQVARNSEVQAKYDKMKENARTLLVAPHEQQYKSLKTQEKQARAELARQQDLHEAAESRAATARVESGREQFGDMADYRKGKGPLYLEALRQRDEALLVSSNASKEVQRLNERLETFDQQLISAVAALQTANAAYVQEESRIDRQMQADSHWHEQKNGPLSRWMAFEKLRRDPQHGTTVASFDLKAKVTLIALELAFLIVKMFFSPASDYHLRLTRRAHERVAREAHDLRNLLRELRRQTSAGQPRTMRLVSPGKGAETATSNK